MIKREELLKMHDAGFSCDQCVAWAFRDKMGLDEKTVLSLTGGFGGGFRCGEVCGAVSGAVMALNTQVPHVTPNAPEEKAANTKATQEFIHRFQEKFGYLCCRDLKGKGAVPCSELICGAAELLEQMLEARKG